MKEDPSPAIRLHGTYDNKLLPSLLRDAGIHIVMLPGPYAETFGHVMTEALAAGIPVIGARYGALGERVRTHRCGWTIDPEDALGVRRLLENVDRCRVELLRATRAASSVPIASVAQTANRYASLYRRPKLVGRTHKDHRNIRGDAS
jgi:glycosyltransferase involved in cell wall biosynthesis